jgi:hypothetical protein
MAEVVEGGKLNIMGVFSDVNPEGPPPVAVTAYVVATFSGSPAEVGRPRTYRLELRSEDGVLVGFNEETVTLQPPQRPGMRSTHNVIQRMAPLILPNAGDYSFHVLIDGDEKRSIPLHVSSP